jgi:UDP-glucuronate 4-epimerase
MTILLTGAAGFIGYHTAEALLARGDTVIGVDNLNAYYDVRLKDARLARLAGQPGFEFHRADIADRAAIEAIVAAHPEITRIVHLAAQAGVRYSLIDPYSYVQSNLMGQVVMLEAARRLGSSLRHFVYASSSSVYGGNDKLPFSIEDRTDHPLSLYGATKKADELITHSYAHLFRIPTTGLRFFTVYGPWGRPDMAAFLFTRAILSGEPIRLFNGGDMRRDFTYVDDIVSGVVAALDRPPADGDGTPPHRVYNLGNKRAEDLRDFIAQIERATNVTAKIVAEPMQPGDVRETLADIAASERDLGFSPSTTIDIGIPRFVEWYRRYHAV